MSKLEPTYLTCPFCPAQAVDNNSKIFIHGIRSDDYRKFVCPVGHEFIIKADNDKHNRGQAEGPKTA